MGSNSTQPTLAWMGLSDGTTAERRRQRPDWRAALLLVVLSFFLPTFYFAFKTFGGVAFSLIAIPPLAAGWFYGEAGALVGTAIIALVNLSVLLPATDSFEKLAADLGFRSIVYGAVGLVVARARKVLKRAAAENAAAISTVLESQHVLAEFALGNFAPRITTTGAHDPMSEIVRGINMLGEELKATQDALRKSDDRSRGFEAFLENVFASMNEVMIVFDAEGRVTDWNPALERILGYTQRYKLGVLCVSDLIDNDAAREIRDRLVGADPGARLTELRGTLLAKSGQRIPVLINGGVVRDPVGDTASRRGFVISAKDERDSRLVQELKETQAQLIQSAKLASLGTLSAGIAHELNNPLAAVSGFAHLIEEDLRIGKDVSGHARRIVEATERMRKIIDHLLAFARPSADADWQVDDLLPPIHRAIQLLEHRLKTRAISCRVSGGGAKAFCDPVKIESVFQNLLTNSLDAFDQQKNAVAKAISIAITSEAGRIEVTYEDNAGGMPDAILARMFEPFYTTKPVGVGSGLGMSIVYGILKQHNGAIEASSTLGKGTRFVIALPEAADDREEPLSLTVDTDLPATPSSPTRHKPRILVVDDEPDLCSVLERYIEADFVVEAVSDPREALRLLDINRYDALITDLRMPEIDGISLTRSAKRLAPGLPVIIISGHSKEEPLVQEAFAAGAGGLLKKPFEAPAAVRGTIRKMVFPPPP